MVEKLKQQITDIIDETANATNTDIGLSIIASRRKGGLPFGHPMVKTMRAILDELDVKPHVEPSVGELSELIYKEIPSVTIGLTRGANKNEMEETIEINPVFDGLAQLVALVSAIDGGCCDE
jgi:di/tripeptidase